MAGRSLVTQIKMGAATRRDRGADIMIQSMFGLLWLILIHRFVSEAWWRRRFNLVAAHLRVLWGREVWDPTIISNTQTRRDLTYLPAFPRRPTASITGMAGAWGRPGRRGARS